jgi:glycosyltransferase involved in cell wall biosynthesis
MGVPAKAVFTAPNAVDNELYAGGAAKIRAQGESRRALLGLPDRYFLFVGRFVREKGVFDLLDAYRRLDVEIRERVALVVVGDGAVRDELEMKARAIAPGRIIFRGFLQRDQLIAEYALAESFIFPTHTDAWGLAVNEAMACGLPVIVTDVAGCVPDLIEEGHNGYVVPAGNPTELAFAMTRVASDPDRHAAMGKRSTEIIANYSAAHCAAGLAQAAGSGWGSHAY